MEGDYKIKRCHNLPADVKIWKYIVFYIFENDVQNLTSVSPTFTLSAHKMYCQSDVFTVDVKYVYLHCVFQLATCVTDLTETLNKKSQELNDFTEKHNLKIWGQDDASSPNDDGDKNPRTGNVLVASPM